MFTMNEDRFNNFKKTIAHKNYGKYWSEAKNTFNIEFKNNSFINKLLLKIGINATDLLFSNISKIKTFFLIKNSPETDYIFG